MKRRKRKVRTHHRRKTWLFIRPNYTLTHKSKNARMGKGKGNFKRWCTIVHPGRVFIEHLNAPLNRYKRYLFKMQKKLKVLLKFVNKHSSSLKHKVVSTRLATNTNKLQILRLRSQLLQK